MKQVRVALLPAALLVLASSGCGKEAGGEGRQVDRSDEARGDEAAAVAWFVDEAERRGLRFAHDNGHRERFYMPETASGGAGLFDMDGDGDLDAYLIQSGSIEDPDDRTGNRLFANDGTGRFTDVTEQSGLDDLGYGMGLACGDFDDDGDVDVYVTNLGENKLFANDGRGRFTDVTAQAGVGHPGWGSSAGFFDYDRDGDLDLFVVNYMNWTPRTEIPCTNQMGSADYCSPLNYDSPAMDVLYRNDGNGRFTDVTVEAGMNYGFGNGLGYVVGDFDGDDWLDVFVANDGLVDQLWVNQGDGRFVDKALLTGCAVDMEGGVPKAGMGVTAGDIDADGDLDLMVCNLVNESDSVYRNEGSYFTDVTAGVGLGSVSKGFTRFGQGWVEFDNDGWFDLYQSNGRVMQASPAYDTDPYAEPNLLFRGLPGGRFEEVRPRGGTDPALHTVSRAAAFGDVDGDGGVDVLVANSNGRNVSLLMNRVPDRGHWLSLDVRERSGRPAEGAVVIAEIDGRQQRRDVRAGYSYLACNDPRVHLGLGSASTLASVEIRWVDGETTRFGPFDANQVIRLDRPR